MLSSLHPYRYWEEDGQYFFNTPSGAQYVAYFLELPFAKNLYSFIFDKVYFGTHGGYCRDLLKDGYRLICRCVVRYIRLTPASPEFCNSRPYCV